MSAPQFRPGPWHARPTLFRDYGARRPIFDDGLWAICQDDRFKVPVAIVDAGDDHDETTRQRAEDTARLIAAAPELYEALVGLLAVPKIAGTRPLGGRDLSYGPFENVFAKADTALAKARGETPTQEAPAPAQQAAGE